MEKKFGRERVEEGGILQITAQRATGFLTNYVGVFGLCTFFFQIIVEIFFLDNLMQKKKKITNTTTKVKLKYQIEF